MKMINLVLITALFGYSVVIVIYVLYVKFVLRNTQIKNYVALIDEILRNSLSPDKLSNVSVIIPCYNEEAVMAEKLQNIAQFEYPIEKIEVILVDDSSTDKTCEIAENLFKSLGLRGKIVRNGKRMGPNASYNNGVLNATGDFILRTDADVIVKPDALRKAVQVISSIENVGGVTGTMAPISENSTVATIVEERYRGLFDKMSIAESALHSTFLGGGGFALIDKRAFSLIPVDKGATDANISLSVIKKGFRYIYISELLSMEPISCKIKDQVRQKIRRASRLLQSIVMNLDALFNKKYGEFGMTIFPLRLMMLVFCPVFTFVGIFSTILLIFLYSMFLAMTLFIASGFLLFISTKTRWKPLNLIASFIMHQFYLLLGLFLSFRKFRTWKSTRKIC